MGASASFSRLNTNASSSSGCLIVSIDGNIGSGKTTGKAKLRQHIMSLKRKNDEDQVGRARIAGFLSQVKKSDVNQNDFSRAIRLNGMD